MCPYWAGLPDTEPTRDLGDELEEVVGFGKDPQLHMAIEAWEPAAGRGGVVTPQQGDQFWIFVIWSTPD